MPTDTLIQTRIDPAIEARASEILEAVGLSVSDAVRLLLTRTATEGALPFAMKPDDGHDAWFRAKVREALDDPRPDVDNAEVEAEFGARRRVSLAEAERA
jgi:DNA-damage-inducible protein J